MTTTFVRRVPMPSSAEVTKAMWIGLAAAYIGVVTVGMTRISYDIWGGLVLGPMLGALTLPLMRRIVRRDDPAMVNLITLAFLVKMVGTVLRYMVTFNVYGYGDSSEYHDSGSRLAHAFWGGTFSEALSVEVPDLIGTEFIRLTTGLLYVVTGPTLFGGFVAYAVLSFWGLFFFYRALRTAFPDADYMRYAKLLFFLPSLLYWPSATGKEAWMLFTIGLATYGVALILRHNPLGYPYAGFGIAGTAMVRPHITALVLASLLVAYVLRRRSWRESRWGPFGKWAGIAVLLAAGGFMIGQVSTFFKLDELDSQSVDTVLSETDRRSSQGGSEFESVQPSSPAGYPMAVVTVMFRPFPWEAPNSQALSAAFEGFVLAGVCAVSWRRLIRVPGFIFRVPFLSYCVAYSAMFVFAFSAINNFGLLSRQRTQLLPLVLVLLAVPPPRIDDGDDLIDDARPRFHLERVGRRVDF
ncbi:MAG: hypothetical protein ACRD2C_01785 [Acidimicrobiales bacterium]